MNQIIEVRIKKLKINYIATCDLFPKCKGVGKSKKEALSKLSKSISKSVEDLINQTLKGVFDSNNFTQVVVDQSKEPYEEVIGYSLNSKLPQMTKNILFKVPTIIEDIQEEDESELSDLDIGDSDFQLEDIFASNSKTDEAVLDNDVYEQLTFHQKANPDSGSIVFGFPLNFN